MVTNSRPFDRPLQGSVRSRFGLLTLRRVCEVSHNPVFFQQHSFMSVTGMACHRSRLPAIPMPTTTNVPATLMLPATVSRGGVSMLRYAVAAQPWCVPGGDVHVHGSHSQQCLACLLTSLHICSAAAHVVAFWQSPHARVDRDHRG